jgi:hypothetical protein
MTFSKHNWNQLSESSQRELKLREAYESGRRQGLNEQPGTGNVFGDKPMTKQRAPEYTASPPLKDSPHGCWPFPCGEEGDVACGGGTCWTFRDGNWVATHRQGTPHNNQAPPYYYDFLEDPEDRNW